MSTPYDTPVTYDAAAIAEYTAGVLYAREDYYARTAKREGIDYAARTAASEKQQRYRARKKEQK